MDLLSSYESVDDVYPFGFNSVHFDYTTKFVVQTMFWKCEIVPQIETQMLTYT